jgi:hypothetical protein
MLCPAGRLLVCAKKIQEFAQVCASRRNPAQIDAKYTQVGEQLVQGCGEVLRKLPQVYARLRRIIIKRTNDRDGMTEDGEARLKELACKGMITGRMMKMSTEMNVIFMS